MVQRVLASLAVSIWLAAPARGGEVLVPEFTPGTEDDFTVAFMLYSMLIDRLAEEGVEVVDADALHRIAGDDAQRCAESIVCPSSLWGYMPDASLTIVGTVTQTEDGVRVLAEWYERDSMSAFKNVDRHVSSGDELTFADALARATVVLLNQVAPPPAAEPEPEGEPRKWWPFSRGGDGADEEGRKTRSRERDVPDPEPVVAGRSKETSSPMGLLSRLRSSPEAEAEADPTHGRQRRSMRVPRWAYEDWRASGMNRERWIEEHQVRTGRFAAELALGAVVGDVHRSYDVRLALDTQNREEVGRYQRDAFTGGVGGSLGLGLYFGPLWWCDVGVRLGLDRGSKEFGTGWETMEGGQLSGAESDRWKAAAASRGVVEPRVRLTPVALGRYRPWAVGFLNFRFYDDYRAQELEGVTYPGRGGGVAVAPGGGVGGAYELSSQRNVFLEATWASRLAPQDFQLSRGLLVDQPQVAEASGAHLRLVAGAGLRF